METKLSESILLSNKYGFTVLPPEPASSLVWRKTSRAEDETLAIAGLVNVDAREYLHMNG